jgi:hypothetical protein
MIKLKDKLGTTIRMASLGVHRLNCPHRDHTVDDRKQSFKCWDCGLTKPLREVYDMRRGR